MYYMNEDFSWWGFGSPCPSCEFCNHPKTHPNAVGCWMSEDGERYMAICETCSTVRLGINCEISHIQVDLRIDDLTMIGRLYGCLIDGRTQDLPAFYRDREAQKTLQSHYLAGERQGHIKGWDAAVESVTTVGL